MAGRTMKRIETTADVAADGSLSARVPADVPAGTHQVIVIVNDVPSRQPVLDLPAHDLGEWPPGLTLRREDLYDACGD